MQAKELIEFLRDGADADIWYDAAAYGEAETAEYIDKIKTAMKEAAAIIENID